jgi:hypothetical protein
MKPLREYYENQTRRINKRRLISGKYEVKRSSRQIKNNHLTLLLLKFVKIEERIPPKNQIPFLDCDFVRRSYPCDKYIPY